MARFRNKSNDERNVPAYGKTIAPDGVLEVPDEDVDGFAGQDDTWAPVGATAKPAKAAAKEQTEAALAEAAISDPTTDEE